MVPREGSVSGCRPDVILFHHRAEFGCLAWIRTKTNGVKTRHAAVTPRGKELVEPEVVATSPCRIKSPVPVYCGFDSLKFGGRERTCTSKAHRLSICGVCCSRITTRPKTGAPSRNGLPESCKSDANKRRSLREPQCTELIPISKECISSNALGAKTGVPDGFAPVISCVRGRYVDWTTLQGHFWPDAWKTRPGRRRWRRARR